MPKPKQPYSVALLIETSSLYGRQILTGIQRFVRTNKEQEWIAVIQETDLNAGVPGWLDNWPGDGVISRQTTDQLKEELRNKDIAIVDLTDRYPQGEFVTIRSDDEAIGRLGAEHFLERSLPHFGFCGFGAEGWSLRRKNGFENQLKKSKTGPALVYESEGYRQDAKRWEDVKVDLTNWLVGLPTPIGIMACNDLRAKQLIDCCYHAHIKVPESVAILGVDNDSLFCDFCHPPLSSVIPNAEEVGFQSALALSRMFRSKSNRQRTFDLAIPPIGVFARRSSDIVAVDDDDLGIALRFIRDHSCEGITVADVIEIAGMSRSSIERKFRGVIGRSPQQEIRRIQLQNVCTFLSTTDLPIEAIASHCGFEHPEYLHVVFKRSFKMTPGEFRNRNRS
jgi:LacI family transcriptional regulator